MRHVAVRRVTLLLGIAFLLCGVGFAWLVRNGATASPPQREPLEEGAVLFERYCASCHPPDDLRQQLRQGGTARRASLESFLRDHGDATDPEDHLILDYLSTGEVQ